MKTILTISYNFKPLYSLIFVFFVFILLSSCSTTKSIPENDALFKGTEIKIIETEISKKEKKALSRTLKSIVRPRPNSKVLGMPIKLMIYNIGSEKGIGKWLRKKYGEEPVLLSRVNVSNTEELLDNYLENRGFFKVLVTSETLNKDQKAKVRYDIWTGPQYLIENISFPTDSSQLSNEIRSTQHNTLLKPEAPFNLDLIIGERLRINTELKEKGYYYFNSEFLLLEADTSLGNNRVNMTLKIKPETPEDAKQPYKINDILIYSNYNLSRINADTSMTYAKEHRGYLVIDSAHVFKPIIFESSMQFEKDDLYSRRDHNATLSRLINLGNFKFVKNRFEPVTENGELKLDTYYYLTPLPKKSLRAELTGTSKTNNLIGSQITLAWKNRNTFKGAEQLGVNVFAGTELQINGNFAKTTTYRIGGEASISIPRFVVPFFDVKSYGEFVPRTNLLAGYEQLNRQSLFTIRSIRTSFGYTWKENIKKEHQLNPITINYVKPLSISQTYSDSILTNPALARIIEQQFIIGSTYNFNYNQLAGSLRQTGFYFNGLLDAAGNIYGLLSGANWKSNETYNLLGVKFAQYVKTEFDLRYYRQFSPKSNWASRIIIGVGAPYGNSKEMPFVKQFFAGGNNSLRGFRSRTVGPGSYKSVNVGNENALFLADQSGDIKLEFNLEYRRKLFSIIEGALFFDTGNVWLMNNDPQRPGAQFSSKFLKELAMDAGFGIRMDFTILLLRFDFAIPLTVPYAISPPDKKMVVNLAIGYPF
jgi:outer membrane protein assembly factor BamA